MVNYSLDKLKKLLSTKENVEIIDITAQANHSNGTADNNGNIVLYFKGLTDISDFKYTRNGRTLIIEYGNRQRVYVKKYFSNNIGSATSSKVKYIRYDNPNSTSSKDKTINVSIIDAGLYLTEGLNFNYNSKGIVTGTVFSDTINMENSLVNPIGKNDKGLTIKAGKGHDVITGSKFNDTILGEQGTTTYNYDFGKKSGADTIKIAKGENLILHLTYGNDVLTPDSLTYVKLGNDLVIYKTENNADPNNQINLKNFFKISANIFIGDIKILDYIAMDSFDGLRILGHGKISGTKYNDLIMASAENDVITAGLGNDKIYTNGGKDTVVETGIYGHDVIENELSDKVTIKLSSFSADKISYDNDDLVYTTDEKSSFRYKDFLTENSADLWINANKKNYHIIKESDNKNIDLSKNKNNNVIFISSNNSQVYYGAKTQKNSNVICSLNSDTTYNYQGGKDVYIDYGNTSDTYNITLTKSTNLVINDKGGSDNILLNNLPDDVILFFNIDNTGFCNDLMLYNTQAMTSANLSKAIKAGDYKGAIELENYFANGKVENIFFGENKYDMEGWTLYVTTEVTKWLKSGANIKNHSSVNDVFLKGTKAEKNSLLKLFKSYSYSEYEIFKNQVHKYSDYKFYKSGDNLEVYINDKLETLYSDYFVNDSYSTLPFYALNDNGELKIYQIGTDDFPINIVAENNKFEGTTLSDMVIAKNETEINLYNGNDKIMFKEGYSANKIVTTDTGSNDTFIFEDKKYTDFYTKGTLSGSYSAGDPLIVKDGNDLKIGDINVKNIDGKSGEIEIVDMEGKTKNIIIGHGTINGTFESEIIIGSNDSDIVNSNGNNDLIYLGEGNDVLNMTSEEKGTSTGKNTAGMIGIGGTRALDNDLDIPATSVYDKSGNDIYNTTLKEYGLYIEDYAGNDTLNIKYSDNNLMYFFDVINPNHAGENPSLYTDLMICDTNQFTNVGMSVISNMTDGKSMKELMQDLQGSFGYAWIDDHFGGNQTIENINIIDAEGNSSALDIDSEIAETQAKVASWLAGEYKGMFNMFGVKGDYATAWDVIEGSSKSDKAALAMIYSKMM